MKIELKDVLHLYLGCKLRHYYPDKSYNEGTVTLTRSKLCQILDTRTQGRQYWTSLTYYKPILRPLASMTEQEITELYMAMIPDDMEDAPSADEYEIELFHNDGGLMVDGDVAIGANVFCRCYLGQIAIRKCGTIDLFSEDGKEREALRNVPKAYLFLLKKGFDLFGLIDNHLAIDSTTLTPESFNN